MVEERITPLDGVAHEHPIALRAEQISGEEGLHLEVLRALERTPGADRGGNGPQERCDRILAGRALGERCREEPEDASARQPPRKVREAETRRLVDSDGEET